MRIHIHHWNRRYRLSSPHVLVWEQLAESSVRDAFGTAITALLPNDREVIVIRNVRLKLTTAQPTGSSNEFADQWGRAMATAVHDVLKVNSKENVRRFSDLHNQIAEYLEALLTDRDSDAWYFDRVRTPGWTPQTDYTDEINAVIARHLPESSGILSQLSRRGSALPVLRRLAPGLRVRLWREGIRGFSPIESWESERPLFDVALAVVTRWSVARGSVRELSEEERDSAFRVYLAQTEGVTRWNDSQALAEAVDAATVFLLQRFSRKASTVDRSSASVSDEQRDAQSFERLIEPLVQKLDWLDQATLRARLQQRLLGPRAASTAAKSLTNRTATSRTAHWEHEWSRQEPQLLEVLRATDLADEERCLMAYSWMIERHPEWGQDPGLHIFISRLISTQSEFRETGSHPGKEPSTAGALSSLRSEAKAASIAPEPNHFHPDSPVTSPVRAGGFLGAQRFKPSSEGVVTECAGIFLLARGLHDLRIAGLARRSAFPTDASWGPAWLLARMAAIWMGHEEFDDPGFEEFSRLAGSAERESLFAKDVMSSPMADRAFQSQLAETLIGQGTWTQRDQMRILIRESEGGRGVVWGGDAAGRVFPWCAVWHEGDHLSEIVEGWQRELSHGSGAGQSVRLVVDDTSLHLWKPSCGFEVADALSPTAEPWCSEHLIDLHITDHGGAACTASAAAEVVLRHWAKSLQGVGHSSSEYLLQHLIRRCGTIQQVGRHWEVVMESRSLDAALRVSGLLDPLEYFTGQDLVRITFQTVS